MCVRIANVAHKLFMYAHYSVNNQATVEADYAHNHGVTPLSIDYLNL